MDFDTFLKVAFVVMTIVSYIIYRWSFYKERVKPKKYRVEYWMKKKGGFK